MAIKTKIYLTLLISSFLIILIIVFIVFPLFNGIKNNSQELMVRKEKTVELEAENLNLEKFKDAHKEISQFLKEIDNLFIDSEVPLEFINFLEETAEKTGNKLESLSLSDKKIEKDSWDYLVFQISLTSSFSKILIFIEKIENNPYLIEIEGMTISKLAPNQETGLKEVRANFSIKVFAK